MENVEEFIDEVMGERNKHLWENLPAGIKRRIYSMCVNKCHKLWMTLVTELTFNVESLVDMRQMVVSKWKMTVR
jgi:hypothetical protein